VHALVGSMEGLVCGDGGGRKGHALGLWNLSGTLDLNACYKIGSISYTSLYISVYIDKHILTYFIYRVLIYSCVSYTMTFLGCFILNCSVESRACIVDSTPHLAI
jgi:hypothetical protein